jgi:hypothetical protein
MGDRPRPIERYTVAAAAERPGISPEAVRNRISRETLRVEREGGRVFVLLEADTPTDEQRATGGIPTDQSELVAELRERVGDLREQLAQVHERDRENRRIIAALTQRVPAIEAPSEATPSEASPGPTDTPTDRGEAPQADAPRLWWQRIFGE